MDQDELAQDDIQDSEDKSADKPEEVSSLDPLLSIEQGDEFDLGILEPPLPLDETFSEPSKLRIFLRRLVRWLVVVMVIFALGVAATWLTRVAPQQKEIENLEHDLEMSRENADLSASEVEDLLPLVDENAELKSDITAMEMHVETLKIQGDVASAQLALLAEDFVTARASLAGTDTRLDALMRNLDGEDRNTVQGMLTRLDLVLEELGEDSFAAIRDLEVLSSNLAALERSIFGN
jgi:hypothetical protein